jgi:hypothetical protein
VRGNRTVHSRRLRVKTLKPDGSIGDADWAANYDALRAAANCSAPRA